MTQFICYHLGDHNPDPKNQTVPIATGTSIAATMSAGVIRMLSLGISDGHIQVCERDDVTPADFAELTAILDRYFAERAAAASADTGCAS